MRIYAVLDNGKGGLTPRGESRWGCKQKNRRPRGSALWSLHSTCKKLNRTDGNGPMRALSRLSTMPTGTALYRRQSQIMTPELPPPTPIPRYTTWDLHRHTSTHHVQRPELHNRCCVVVASFPISPCDANSTLTELPALKLRDRMSIMPMRVIVLRHHLFQLA